MSAAVRSSNEFSLVIMDEFGKGTMTVSDWLLSQCLFLASFFRKLVSVYWLVHSIIGLEKEEVIAHTFLRVHIFTRFEPCWMKPICYHFMSAFLVSFK